MPPTMTLRALASMLCLASTIALPAPGMALTKLQEKCQQTIGKASGKYLKNHLKEATKCADNNLAGTGSCDTAKRDAKLAKAESKLRSTLQKKCGDAFPAGEDDDNLAALGFPGRCPDDDRTDGFTAADLQDCLFATHRDLAIALIGLQYGANADDAVIDFETRTGDPDLAKDLLKCQREVGKRSLKLVLTVQKEITRCRDDLLRGKVSGFAPRDCADNPIHTKPAEKIAKILALAADKILGRCADPLLANPEMDLCDTGSGPATTAGAASACLTDAHVNVCDDPDDFGTAMPFPTDCIDIEYGATAVCGDGIVNDPALPSALAGDSHLGVTAEECDGADDDACPGACGAAGGPFACLCTDTLRMRVTEHDNGDLDHGESPGTFDQTPPGGTYVVDLYDCDGPAGPDTICTIGPSCALAPHAACIADSDCAGGGNFCRTTAAAVAPRCNSDLQRSCATNADCPDPGDYCRRHRRGVPQPFSGSGVATCEVNVFAENVTGTVDLATGASVYRLRENMFTHLASGTLNQPCPVCGGFCSGTSGGPGPGQRTLCAADSDCPASSTCVTDAICSYGPNQDEPCRRDPPFGAATVLFGNPSIDCPPSPGNNLSGDGQDVLYDPMTTGAVTSVPSVTCDAAGHGSNKCVAGASTGALCVADSDCPGGGAGSCAPQCYCPTLGPPSKPNDCWAACRGGSNDYAACGSDSDCPGGVCEPASCRVAAGVCTFGPSIGTACGADSDCGIGGRCGDDDSSGEGFCPSNSSIGYCSHTTIVGCLDDSYCRPSGTCSFCLGDESETCVFQQPDCIPTISHTHTGTPGIPTRVDVAHYCIIEPSLSSVVNKRLSPAALEVPVSITLTP